MLTIAIEPTVPLSTRTHPIATLIRVKINQLANDVRRSRRYMYELILESDVDEKYMRVFARIDRLFKSVLHLQENHTSYFKRPYRVKSMRKEFFIEKGRFSRIGEHKSTG